MKKIIVFGSINTDLVISTNRMPDNGETLKGHNFFTSQGGKGANQAVAAAKLGGNVTMIGCVGNDNFGQKALDSLNEYGVLTNYIEKIDNTPSGIAMIIKVDGDNRIILDSGANQNLNVEHFKKYIEHENVKDSIMITQLENDQAETIKALKLAKKSGMLTILNPAPAVKLASEVYQDVDILVVNQTETQILAGIYPETKEECERAYQIFSKLGVKTLIITLGKEGSMVLEQANVVKITGKVVKAVDSTGAGDAYIGTIAYGIANGLTISESAKLANQVSALTVMKHGAQVSMPTMNEIKEYFKEDTK